MKRQAEAAAEVEEVAEVEPVEEGPAHRVKVADPANLIVGQQYRIHRKGQSYESDKLGTFIHRDQAHDFPVFNNINNVDPEDGERFTHNTPIRYSPEDYIFYESGKTITAQKVFDPRGLPPQLLNRYGGSRPVKRRTIRRRRRHRTIKRRYVAI